MHIAEASLSAYLSAIFVDLRFVPLNAAPDD